jgi:hypothetical protein
MINAKKGEFKLDGYDLVIHPGLSLSDFNRADIPILETHSIEESGYTFHSFSGVIDALEASFVIEFEHERLLSLRFQRNESNLIKEKMLEEEAKAKKTGNQAQVTEVLNKWGKVLGQAHIEEQHKNDRWLEKLIGHPPPYEFDWGRIISHEDGYTGGAEISIIFRQK